MMAGHPVTVALPALQDSHGDELCGWLAAARRGDAGGIEALLRRYRSPLVRLLTAVTGDAAEAEDLAQEAFLVAFRRIDELRDPARFYAWIRRLALREAIRSDRKRRARSASEPLVAVAPDPAVAADHRLTVERILATLPAGLRAALVLRELEQLDYSEIAAALAIPVGTVRSRLFAARERFRRAWTESEDSP